MGLSIIKKEEKGAKPFPNMRWELGCKKCSKKIFKVLGRQDVQNQTLSELHTDDNESKYSCNFKDIFKSAKKKKFIKNFTPRNKISNKNFNVCETKRSLD